VLAYNDAFFATFVLAAVAIGLLLLHILWNNRHRFLHSTDAPQTA